MGPLDLRIVVWPWTEHVGNWDCAFAQISDGEILMHTRVCSFMAPSALKGAPTRSSAAAARAGANG